MVWSRLVFYLFIFCFLVSCARFKVDHLSIDKVATLKLGEKVNEVSYPHSSNLIHSIPERLGVIGDFVILSEPSRFTIKVFEENKLSFRIGSAKYIQKAEPGLKLIEDLHIPGRIVVGQDNDFYVESFSPSASNSDSGLLKILHFKASGQLLGKVGRNARTEMPFSNILWFDTDKENRLWILYRNFGTLHLEAHKDSTLLYSFDEKKCKEIIFSKSLDDKEIGECDLMFPTFDGENIMFAGRVDKILKDSSYQFQYRKVIIHDLELSKNREVFSRLNDPDDIPYLPRKGSILLFKPDSYKRLTFALYNDEGNLVNNIQIDFPGRYHEWRSTYLTLSGKFYSQRIYNNELLIYEWK